MKLEGVSTTLSNISNALKTAIEILEAEDSINKKLPQESYDKLIALGRMIATGASSSEKNTYFNIINQHLNKPLSHVNLNLYGWLMRDFLEQCGKDFMRAHLPLIPLEKYREDSAVPPPCFR